MEILFLITILQLSIKFNDNYNYVAQRNDYFIKLIFKKKLKIV